MNIIVTGGAGFIGSHLVDRLINDGHRVLVIDNLSTGLKAFVNDRAEFLQMDIRDPKLGQVFCDFKPTYVFHEAAQTMVPDSMKDPANDCDINLKGLINVLEACRQAGVDKILTPSSAAVYGDLDSLPLTEEMTGQPTSFYGLTKMTMEHYLRIYRDAFGLDYICFRYSNVYGSRQGDGGEGGVISIFAKLAVQDKTLQIFGDGQQTRDFIYVDDVVEANICGMNHKAVTGVFNVSTNKGVSVNSLVKTFNTVTGKELSVDYGPERAGDIRHSRLDNEKAKVEIGFTAKVPLEEGLVTTYEYFLQNK